MKQTRTPEAHATARLLLALLVVVACAQAAAHADRVDELVAARMRQRHVPGLALAVVRDGRVVKARGYGLANVELNVPVTTETVFEIGSITKQFTASAVMLLVEDGKINLDDKISRHLSGLPGAWDDITVRHLLTHTSGVRNYTGLAGFELSRRLKRDEFVKLVAAHPLAFRPGEQWSYGNTAYNLLGHIVESASGQTYWEFVNSRLFRPAGMASTRDRDPRNVIPKRADGYEWEGGRLVGRDHDLTDVFSAGAITSTVLDLARWDAALYTERPLKSSLREQMWTPVRLSGGHAYPYGFGWSTLTWRGRRLVFHGGQTAGFAASIQRFLDDRLTVVVLSNLGDIGLSTEVARRVAKFYLPALSLRALRPPPDPDPQLTARLRRALDDRLSGRLDDDWFTPQLRAALGSERAREVTRRIAAYGAPRSFEFVEYEPAANPASRDRASRYRLLAERGALLLRFAVNADGKLSGMALEEEEEWGAER